MIRLHQQDSRQRREMIDISSRIQLDVEESGVKDGLCLVFVRHTTAALTVNENADPAVKDDMLRKLAQLVPADDGYLHSEGNSDAHILSSLLGCCLTLPVIDGRLALGTWQGIFFCEFDGPRRRSYQVKVVADPL